MTAARQRDLVVGGATLRLPCFFPSVSSVKTNLRPADYVELLAASKHPLYLVSAFDIANAGPDDETRLRTALGASRNGGTVILLDSGNYEAYWMKDTAWNVDTFHSISRAFQNDLCLCYDNQQPGSSISAIADDVVASVLRDQAHAIGTIVPITHGPADLLPAALQKVAKELCPVLLAVPERTLGDGILARVRTVRRIRQALDSLGSYCPLHLLGTGDPVSIICYSLAGADSFDGLEWCQTAVDHRSGSLLHFHQWDFVRDQTEWGANRSLPYIQSVLMHNLTCYSRFMRELQDGLAAGCAREVAGKYLHSDVAAILWAADGDQ